MLELTSGKLLTIRLNGRSVKYRVRRFSAIKRRRLLVSPGGVVVMLPKSDREDRAVAFIRQNAAWVTQEVAALTRRAEAIVGSAGRRTMLLGGETVAITVRPVGEKRFTHIERNDRQLTIHLAAGASASAKLESWLRETARKELVETVTRRAAEMGVRPRQIYIRGQRTKWGNCSRLRNLSFNCRLVMVPPVVLDYLVVHELAHLKEMSHSSRFWLLVRQACPDYARHQQWLRANAHRLSLPDVTLPPT